MKAITRITAISAAFFFLQISPQIVKAQSFKLSSDKEISIKILGSSNVHDWTMVSSAMQSQGDFKLDDNGLQKLNSLSFTVHAKSLKSESKSMDERTYKTIKADKFPNIQYKLSSAVVTPTTKNKYLIKTTGDLTIGGVTQTIYMNVNAVVSSDNTITCTGSEKLKLTDYKISPPSFMLGAMKVGNDLTIEFNLIYKKSTLTSAKN